MATLQTVEETRAGENRTWWVENAVPFLTSVGCHAAVIAVGLAMYKSAEILLRTQVQTRIPEAPALVSATSAIDSSAPGEPAHDWARPRSDSPDPAAGANPHWGGSPTPASFAGAQWATPDMIAPGGDSGPVRGTRLGTGGDSAPFGLPTVGGARGMFDGAGGCSTRSARSVAFLCDASGSMLAKFGPLRAELNKAIQSLRPNQSFAITFFQGSGTRSFAPQLLMATPQNKLKACAFLDDVTPRSATDPIPSLELAFKQQPQLIYLLTDGDFPDNAAVLKRITELNKDHKVKINTIAFVGESDTDTAFMQILKQVATENGGVFRRVSEDELRQ